MRIKPDSQLRNSNLLRRLSLSCAKVMRILYNYINITQKRIKGGSQLLFSLLNVYLFYAF